MVRKITPLLVIGLLTNACGDGGGSGGWGVKPTAPGEGIAEHNDAADSESEPTSADLSSDRNAEVAAPTSIRGKKFQMVVDTGFGVFAVRGSFTVAFSEFSDKYSLTGDVIDVVNSAGSYSYMSEGSAGTISFNDSAVSSGTFTLLYQMARSGSFKATATSDANSYQLGEFWELE